MTTLFLWMRGVRKAVLLAAALLVPAVTGTPSRAADGAAPRPERRVAAVYFHRTVRCPTCQKVGAAIEEALKTRLAAELRDGRVEWLMMDFQDPRNQGYVSAFGVTGPTLILMDVRGDKVVAWKPAPRCWSLLSDRDAFFAYVEAEVRSLLPGQRPAAGAH